MPPRPDALEFERFVLRRQASVHTLALRMTGDAAEAEDATQETFLRAFERFDLLDPARDEVAWIRVVATRVVLNRLRAARPRRRALEAAAAAPAIPVPEEPAVERREREETVARHVARLAPDERAAIVLEYYVGLPQAKVAETLGVPRTTVQSRVARALAALRASLSPTGALAGLPLEDVMRETPAPPVPDALTRSLLDAARAAAGSASAAPLVTLGGLAVTKSVALVAAAVALALLGGGYAVGRAFADRGDGAPAASSPAAAEYARLVEENARLKDAFARRLPTAPATAGGRGAVPDASPAADGATARAGAEALEGAAPAGADGAVDWNRFAEVWAASYADLAAMMIDPGASDDGTGDPTQKWTPEQQAKVMELWVEFTKASARARKVSENPFFDRRVLPGLADAMFSKPLGLSSEARTALVGRVGAVLDAAGPTLASGEDLALARFETRRRVIDRLVETVAESVPEEARPKLDAVERISREMLLGERSERRITLEPQEGRGTAAERVLDAWREDFALDASQADSVRPLAEGFARDAAASWRRHQMDHPDVRAVPAKRRAHEDEVLHLQVEAERALLHVLTPGQRKVAAEGFPRVILPNAGGDVTSKIGSGGI